MATPWRGDGSDADYWRSDNPFINFWYRFGDESLSSGSIETKVVDYQTSATPPFDLERSYMSGLLVDSGPRQWHLMWGGGGVNRASRIISPTSGFAPFATDGSGMCFSGIDSNLWPVTSHNETLFVWSELWNETFAGSNLGQSPFAFGTSNLPSGACVMGWFKVPEPDPADPNPTFFDQIFGNMEFSIGQGGNFSHLAIGYRPTDLRPIVRYRTGVAAATGAMTGDAGFPLAIDEPMFLCVQVHREDGVPGGFQNRIDGSGIIRLWMGSHVSGLREVAANQIVDGTDTRFRRQSNIQNQWCFGQDSQSTRSPATHDTHVPPGFCLDEWVCLVDGRLSRERIEYYMNSGINHLEEDDPTRPEFTPVSPGTQGLLGYWTFDDNTGTNSAPATSGQNDMDMEFGTAVGGGTPVPGIRGGSGVRTLLNVFRSAAFGSSTWNSSKIATGPGSFNEIFPDINVSDQWTWIGWMDPVATGAAKIRYGGSVGWFGGGSNHRWTAYGIGDWANTFSAGLGQDRQRGMEWSPSGMTQSSTNGTFNGGVWGGGGLVGHKENTWQLWAFVFDFRHGLFYSVRDAKHMRFEDQRVSSVSGFSKNELPADLGLNFGFGFGSINNTNNSTRPRFDDWAVYNRKLTLPEMSGYALSGVAVTPIISPISTTFKQTLGYWTFSPTTSGIYDPEVVSGLRFEDQSWYRHHLTNVSGTLETNSTDLNDRVEDGSLEIKTSGAMLSAERILTGSNLDFASNLVFPSSGFCAGAWMQLPSQDSDFTDLGGDHHIMGSWGTDITNQSWQLGIKDNKPFFSVHADTSPVDTLEATEDVPSGTPFFIGALVTPSGAAMTAEIYLHTADFEDPEDLRLVARSTTFSINTQLNAVGASGFSLFNVPNRQQGFPSGTLFQGPFVYAGALDPGKMSQLVRAGIDNVTLTSGAVSATDPANISHWPADFPGSRLTDEGLAQNLLFPINTDGNTVGTFAAIHSSGVVIRRPEYYDTLASNAQSSGLDLGAESGSWTFLTWVIPPEISSTDEHVIMNKGSGPADDPSGVKVFTPSDSLNLRSISSGNITQAQNGDLAPGQWNHMAIVYDRDNNEYTTIINGRYAGPGFQTLLDIPINNSGMTIGGRGDQEQNALAGGSAFSGLIDDAFLYKRALTLPEISGLAANTLGVNDGSTVFGPAIAGGYLSGLPLFAISGLIGSFMHGQAQDLELVGGYVSGVSGFCIPFGGFMHGKAFVSGVHGGFMHGAQQISGTFGHFIHGLDIVSGFIGSYEFGACESNGEFDITLNFSIVTNEDFDARLGVEKTSFVEFDSKLGVIRITRPPGCTLEMPLVGEIGSGTPFTLTVQGSGFAFDDKQIAMTRFTFADFKGAESGTLVSGIPNSGLFEASRGLDTPGWYTVKIEVLDTFGYRSSCCRPFLLLPSGSTSGTFINSLPGIELTATPKTGATIQRVLFQHAISGLDTTSGLLEYTDFADQQESLVNSLEMPSGTQFTAGFREHDYTMPGRYCPVWALSGSFGIVSDSIADGIDYLT